MSKKHTFDLKITASKLNEIHMKYDLKKSALASNDTSNTTKIDIVEATDTLNFLDETRKLHKCILAKIDFGSLEGYKCFWCRNVCPPEKTPVGCPTKYISPVVYRNYFSEINKEKFVVKESCLKTDKIVVSDDIAVENNDYYAESELLIHRIAGKKVEPAPHWRLLKEYGGILDIKEFRDSFHHTEFQPFGVCAKPFFQSVAHTFESKIKF
jgi:hypothetical protein